MLLRWRYTCITNFHHKRRRGWMIFVYSTTTTTSSSFSFFTQGYVSFFILFGLINFYYHLEIKGLAPIISRSRSMSTDWTRRAWVFCFVHSICFLDENSLLFLSYVLKMDTRCLACWECEHEINVSWLSLSVRLFSSTPI